MAVIRINKNKNFTVMSNVHLRERDMTLKAKGLLCLMLSLPEDWDYSVAGLCAICKENDTAVKSTLRELQDFGYLVVTKKMPNETKSGRIEYIYDIFEQPHKKQATEKQGVENLGVENLGVENLDIEFQDVENPGQLNTQKENTKKRNKEIENTKENNTVPTTLESFRASHFKTNGSSKDAEVKEVIDHLNKITHKKYSATNKESIKLITARLKEGYTVEQMKQVIEHRWQLWKGTDMEQYVCPTTLFRPSKFDKYLNNLGAKRRGSYQCPDSLSMLGVPASKVEEEEQLSDKIF